MAFTIKRLTSDDFERMVADARRDEKCNRYLRMDLERYRSGRGYRVGTWVVDDLAGQYLIEVRPPAMIPQYNYTYALFFRGRLYRIRVDYGIGAEVFFSDDNPPADSEKAEVEQAAISALKTHGMFGGELKHEERLFGDLIFIERPDYDFLPKEA